MVVPQHGATSLPALARHHGVLLPHRSKELTRALASPSVTQDLSASRGLESAIDAETMQVTSENQQLGGAPAVALVRDDNEHHGDAYQHQCDKYKLHGDDNKHHQTATNRQPSMHPTPNDLPSIPIIVTKP